MSTTVKTASTSSDVAPRGKPMPDGHAYQRGLSDRHGCHQNQAPGLTLNATPAASVASSA